MQNWKEREVPQIRVVLHSVKVVKVWRKSLFSYLFLVYKFVLISYFLLVTMLGTGFKVKNEMDIMLVLKTSIEHKPVYSVNHICAKWLGFWWKP